MIKFSTFAFILNLLFSPSSAADSSSSSSLISNLNLPDFPNSSNPSDTLKRSIADHHQTYLQTALIFQQRQLMFECQIKALEIQKNIEMAMYQHSLQVLDVEIGRMNEMLSEITSNPSQNQIQSQGLPMPLPIFSDVLQNSQNTSSNSLKRTVRFADEVEGSNVPLKRIKMLTDPEVEEAEKAQEVGKEDVEQSAADIESTGDDSIDTTETTSTFTMAASTCTESTQFSSDPALTAVSENSQINSETDTDLPNDIIEKIYLIHKALQDAKRLHGTQ